MLLEVREISPGCLQVAGPVDLTSVAGMRERLIEAVDRAISDEMPILTVDLHAVAFMDAAGLGVLLGAHRRARRGGSRLRLVRVNADLMELLRTSRLYRVLDVDLAERPTGPAQLVPADAVPGPRDESDDVHRLDDLPALDGMRALDGISTLDGMSTLDDAVDPDRFGEMGRLTPS